MPNFAVVLKDEIKRLARKEVRKGTPTLRRSSAQFRRDIASLKKELKQAQKKITFLLNQESKKGTVVPASQEGRQFRFSPIWLKKHRDKLNLSALDYGKLVGVSLQTIYQWEQGKTTPRRSQLPGLGAVRELGKREANQKLELINQKNGTPKRKRGRPAKIKPGKKSK